MKLKYSDHTEDYINMDFIKTTDVYAFTITGLD